MVHSLSVIGKNTQIKTSTAFKLGLSNLARVAFYQLGVRSGINPAKRLQQAQIHGDLYHLVMNYQSTNEVVGPLPFKPFGWMKEQPLCELCWNKNSLTGKTFKDMDSPWFQLSDFNSDIGDIKGIWETSRFDWALGLAKEYLSGRSFALTELNHLCSDWLASNPFYKGPNWKCGQEASIRVMHLAFTAKLLSQVENAEPSLLELIKAHLQRIAPTILYALAQDNNHGTSEAAALFIGGSWLAVHNDPDGKKWMLMGRKWLENRAKRLIETDGSFSQYSTNYHRVMLDTYAMVEIWRRDLNLPVFSQTFYQRLAAATQWLYQLTQPRTGDVPNLGANDGARLLPLSQTDYRDYRPSVQLASTLFLESSVYREKGDYDEPLHLLGVKKLNGRKYKLSNSHMHKGGYFVLRAIGCDAFVVMTYPKFRFRPSQCDALHVDLWLAGQNLLRDGGTFSYNAGNHYIDYYGGTNSHNTVQFDDHDQMPRLSRFLLGAWLKAKEVVWKESQGYCLASYKDYLGCCHKRELTLSERMLQVIDHITGVKNKAVLRWRLMPGHWVVQGNTVTNGVHSIIIQSDAEFERFELAEGKESRYYYQETSIPVLEIEVSSNATITTEYHYK